MSLNYDLTKCEALNALTEEERDALWPTTQSIIFQTMGNGMGEITEANVSEFYARQVIFCKLFGYTPNTAAEIKQHIGLGTNVFPEETRAKWTKRMMVRALERETQRYKRDTTEGAE